MADTELAVGKVDELKARLLHVKQIEEERIAALETLKQELEQQEREESSEDEVEEEEEEDEQRMAHNGQALVDQLDKRIKAIQREMQEKRRSQELRKRQLMDEREELVKQIAAEVEEMKAMQSAARTASGSSGSSYWLKAAMAGVGLTVLCGVSYAFLEANGKLRLPVFA
ncbi:uncharacterized protein ACA1_265530 [Acanthamoeba castellanii str. Neff]|uniref:Uncharacterized protein n=1 Tax=Acanthamoeba castellanii (strain ATCC 30010 / Neff) TaxID=1257118 RepID=L8H3N4_ACACF|nr:uncharacterized protein ACA1_265530 [Acanthamoeba castellanii str. Neff]ELR19348.1 hypothetical protein ACA1_265530 [Acanthamoeba castellanii str. Neff]